MSHWNLRMMILLAILSRNSEAFQDSFCSSIGVETTPVQASPHDFVVLPCRVRRGKDLVWVRCNTESEKTELLIFKSGHLNEAGGLLVRSNGSLILPDAREGVTSEYRCYRVHGNSRILRSRFNLSVKGKSMPTWIVPTICVVIVLVFTLVFAKGVKRHISVWAKSDNKAKTSEEETKNECIQGTSSEETDPEKHIGANGTSNESADPEKRTVVNGYLPLDTNGDAEDDDNRQEETRIHTSKTDLPQCGTTENSTFLNNCSTC